MTARQLAAIGGGAIFAALMVFLAHRAPPPPRTIQAPPDAPRPSREAAIRSAARRKLAQLNPDEARNHARHWPPGQRHVLWTMEMEQRVEAAGFLAYLSEGTGRAVPDAAEGYRAIGGTAYAALIERAIALQQRPPGSERDRDYLALDEEFFQLLESLPPSMLRARYIDAHPDEFPE